MGNNVRAECITLALACLPPHFQLLGFINSAVSHVLEALLASCSMSTTSEHQPARLPWIGGSCGVVILGGDTLGTQ